MLPPYSRIVAVFVLVALVMGTFIVAETGADDPRSTASERWKGVARTRVETDPRPVLRVGNEVVTMADFAAQVASYEMQHATMVEDLASGRAAPFADAYQARLDLIDTYGIETVALARLIRDRAVAQESKGRGHGPSRAQIDKRVADDRKLVDQGMLPELSAYIEVVGSDEYWSRLYPAIIERELAMNELHSSIVSGLQPDQRSAAWATVRQQSVEQTSIQVLDRAALGSTTVEQALAYITEALQLEANEPS